MFFPLILYKSPEYCRTMAGDFEEGELKNNRDDKHESSRSSQVDHKRVRDAIYLKQRNLSFLALAYTNGL